VSRLNGYTRKKLYRQLARRDGEFCRCCGALPWEKQLVIDHRDNDNNNNNPENHQLLCRVCNYLKNPRRPVDVCVSEGEAPDQTELEKNRTTEPLFRKYVAHEINEKCKVSEQDLINGGAEHVGISPVTAKRHMNKMCSPDGFYQRKRIGGTVVVYYKDEVYFR